MGTILRKEYFYRDSYVFCTVKMYMYKTLSLKLCKGNRVISAVFVCMRKHMSDLEGVFENAFVVFLFWKLEIKVV